MLCTQAAGILLPFGLKFYGKLGNSKLIFYKKSIVKFLLFAVLLKKVLLNL